MSLFIRNKLPHQVGQLALVANGVRVVAEVANDLDETLLRSGVRECAPGRTTQQALSRQSQY
jgi:hypothetical protein